MTTGTKKRRGKPTIAEKVQGERAAPPPATPSAPLPSPPGARLEHIPIRAHDKKLVRLAVTLLGKQLTSAKAMIDRLDLEREILQRRSSHADALKALLDETPDAKDLMVPAALARTLRIALALELDGVAKLEKEQEGFLIEDDDVPNRMKRLEAMIHLLDDQLTLPFGGEGSAGQG